MLLLHAVFGGAAVSDNAFGVDLTRRERFQFDVDFGKASWPRLLVDEPEPLGDGAGPGPSRVLAAAIGSCLAASLSFCLGKAHVPLEDLCVRVEGASERNEEGRLRIREITVRLEPRFEGEPSPRVQRCLDVFEQFCTVTESVRAGIDVAVDVLPTYSGFTEPSGAETG